MQEDRDEWITLFNGYPYLSDIFCNLNEWLEYAFRFQKIYGNLSDASTALCNIAEYYQYINLLYSRIPKRRKNVNLLGVSTIPNSKKEDNGFPERQYKRYEDVIALLMTISLIEKLSSKTQYLTFGEWIKKNNLQCDKPQKAWDTYNQEYGCSKKFRAFFTSDSFLTKEQKISLVRSITFGANGQTVPLFCYSEKCAGRKYHCLYNNADCIASRDKTVLKKALKELANFLYVLRSKFVHDACMFTLADTGNDSFVFEYFPYRFQFSKVPKEFDGFLFISLNVILLKQVLDSNFKKLLDYFIDNNSV
jgi:hypothetical protein